MERKNTKQLHNKLLFTYTAVIVCVVLALMTYFYNSMKNRYLENNLEYMQMMHTEAQEYLEACSDQADYVHEGLYQSNMEIRDVIHYLTDSPEEYQEYRLDTYSENNLMDYNGIEDFAANAFEAYPDLKRLAFISYSKADLTSFSGSQNVYLSENVEDIRGRVQSGNLADEGEFSFLKEIRDPVSMQSMGAMILTFDTQQFERIKEYYDISELIVYNDSETLIYASSADWKVHEIESARQRENLEDLLKAYTMDTSLEKYHIVSWLGRSKAASVPQAVIWMIVGVAVLVFLVSELLVRYYLQRVSRRLNGILDGMTKVMGGDLTVRLETEKNGKNGDELDVIADHFNEMCVQLDTHIQKQYLAEIEQKNAEMAALQSYA